MTWYLVLIAGIATLFYAAFPAIGAFLVRSQWRVFRNRVTAVSRYPTASALATGRERTATTGLFRFFGSLEAIQGTTGSGFPMDGFPLPRTCAGCASI